MKFRPAFLNLNGSFVEFMVVGLLDLPTTKKIVLYLRYLCLYTFWHRGYFEAHFLRANQKSRLSLVGRNNYFFYFYISKLRLPWKKIQNLWNYGLALTTTMKKEFGEIWLGFQTLKLKNKLFLYYIIKIKVNSIVLNPT